MMQFLKDMISFLHTLSLIDFILYFAILTLIVLVISLVYIIRNNEEEKPIQEEPDDNAFDLKEVARSINEKPAPLVDMTSYEEEQEEKAIISYDELLKTAPQPILYEEEQLIDDEVNVKKISVDSLPNIKKTVQKDTMEVKLKYRHEEAFLEHLKELCQLLQ